MISSLGTDIQIKGIAKVIDSVEKLEILINTNITLEKRSLTLYEQ